LLFNTKEGHKQSTAQQLKKNTMFI